MIARSRSLSSSSIFTLRSRIALARSRLGITAVAPALQSHQCLASGSYHNMLPERTGTDCRLATACSLYEQTDQNLSTHSCSVCGFPLLVGCMPPELTCFVLRSSRHIASVPRPMPEPYCEKSLTSTSERRTPCALPPPHTLFD